MKAVIIYDDSTSAAWVNAALQHSAKNAGFAVRWSIKPWRVDLLEFEPTAEEALADAADASLFVFVGRCVRTIPFWLQDWMEQWAFRRQVEDVALAVIHEKSAEELLISAAPELSYFAARHGLKLIFEDKTVTSPRSTGESSCFFEGLLYERELSMHPVQSQAYNNEIRNVSQCRNVAK